MAEHCIRRSFNVLSCTAKRYSHTSSAASTSFSVSKLLDLPALEKNVTITGLVRSVRNQKTRSFVALGDGTTLQPLQALLTPEQAQSLSTGSAVCLTGRWQASPNDKVQSHELHVQDVRLIGEAEAATFPLQKKYHSPEYLRTIPHIRTRTPFNSLMLRFRSKSIAQLTQFFANRDFVQTHPPIITSSDCEGAGEVFSLATANDAPSVISLEGAGDGSFFRSPKYLTVSSQLHLEALAQSVGKVWTLSPTFRAEKSDTARHLSEFYMLEAEVNFEEKASGIMDLVEDMLRDLTKGIYDTKIGKELLYGKRTGESGIEPASTPLSEVLVARWQGMMSGPWPRISYSEAIDILQQSNESFRHEPTWGRGLQAEHERYIAASVGKGQPVFVTAYPKAIKPFYMLPSSESSPLGETVECFDLLVPEICEIVGGSMREHRLPELLGAMQSHGLVPQGIDLTDEEALGGLKWYVDLRRWGSVPHGGFGLGFDRLLGYLSGVQNIREVVAFPRWVGRCEC